MSPPPAAPTMHDHIAGHGPYAVTLCFAAAGGLAHWLQMAAAPLLTLCAVGSFAYSTLNFLANWPDTLAKLRKNRGVRRERRRRRIMARYPDEPRR